MGITNQELDLLVAVYVNMIVIVRGHYYSIQLNKRKKSKSHVCNAHVLEQIHPSHFFTCLVLEILD